MRNEKLEIRKVPKQQQFSSPTPHSSTRPLTSGRAYLPIPLFAFLILTLLIGSCDLFNDKLQDDHLAKIDEEIRWANAERLTVRVDYNPLWGSSPQQGLLNRENTRKGHPFDLEFTPLPGYGFEEWLAFPTDVYNSLVLTQTANEVKGNALNEKDVVIKDGRDEAGVRTIRIIINITEPVTIVPWCSNRPRLDSRTYPPLNPVMAAFPYKQQVIIWFTMPVSKDDVEKNIVITGTNADTNNPGRILPFDGDLMDFFTFVFSNYDQPGSSFISTVTLVPKDDEALKPLGVSGNDLMFLDIRVEVGPNIKNKTGIAMAREIISYQTDSSQVQKAYRAANITAEGKTGLFADLIIDYPWNESEIDRRFITGANVALSFSVDQPEDVASLPNKITIIERMAYELNGTPYRGQSSPSTEYTSSQFSFAGTTYTYTINHKLKTEASGIIQLLVLPENNEETPNILPLDSNIAVAEGRYVTVVIDNEAPNVVGDLGASLSEWSSIEAETKIYIYGDDGITVTLGGLGNIADNGSKGGIPASRAWNLPWTMDDRNNLSWELRIGGESTRAKGSGWLSVYDESGLNNKWTLKASDLTDTGGYAVDLRFKDGLDNESVWISTGYKVKYFKGEKHKVTKLWSECNEAGNSISVTWTPPPGLPTDYLYPEIEVRRYRASADGDEEENVTTQALGKTDVSYTFDVSPINSNNVREGIAVSGVYGFKINVITYNTAGTAETGPIWVYNIPGMKVTETNTVRITDNEQLAMSNEQLKGNIVLTRDITIEDHTPIAGFTGKFYGNGHTVTVNGLNTAADMGLFGTVNGGLVRDLTVQYNDVNVTGPDDEVCFGGIAGTATGAAQIENVLVKGSLSFNVSGNNRAYVGGIVGFMTNTTNPAGPTTISKAYSSLKLTVNKPTASDTGQDSLYVGGVAGSMGDPDYNDLFIENINTNAVKVENASVVGDITVGSEGNLVCTPRSYPLCVGGLAGFMTGSRNRDGSIYVVHTAELGNSNYSQGTIMVFSGGYNVVAGGAIGRISGYTTVKECFADAENFVVNIDDLKRNYIFLTGLWVGGFAGDIQGDDYVNEVNTRIEKCYGESPVVVNGLVNFAGNMFVGGFVGSCGSYGNIRYCYAKGNISGFGYSDIGFGGFVGSFMGNACSIEYCYATGDVSVLCNTNQVSADTMAGGFAGTSRSLSDCYALGDVSVDKNGTGDDYLNSQSLLAGALVGRIYASSTIERCFATGSVIAQRNSNVNANQLNVAANYVGGLVGGRYDSSTITLKNCAALGKSVTFTGSGNAANRRFIGRVCGSTDVILQNNYAYDGMIVQSSTINNNTDNENGKNATLNNFRDIIFWIDNGGLAFNTGGSGTGIGSIGGAVWDFSTLPGRGYPILNGVGGQ